MREPGADAPYLSIVLSGRNDDFGGDFTGRLFRALDFNHRELAARGVPHEIIFCEWAPIEGRPWMAELLADRFPDLVPDGLISYVADRAYHDAYSQNPRLRFQEFIAKNVGIRRSRGEYVLTTNAGVYLGRGLLDAFARRALSPGTLYRARRIDLKEAIGSQALAFDALEDPRNQDSVNAIAPPLYSNASGDFLLLDRASYSALRGFNEVSRVARVHVDFMFCLKAYAGGLPLVPLQGDVYHVGRGTLVSQPAYYRLHPEKAPWGNVRRQHAVVYENDDHWGLGEAPVRHLRPGVEHLTFTWAAVRPMVTLAGVVLPGERRNRPSVARQPPPARPLPYPVSVTRRARPAQEDHAADPLVFDGQPAADLNRARMDFLATLDLPLDGQRVLDVGCGVGHLTPFYTSRGCQVVGLDGQPENVARMRELHPDVEGVVGDVQQTDLVALGPFDVVHCFGLLYHVENPVTVLRKLAAASRNVLLLETIVCDATAPIVTLADESARATQALDGLGCRPSPSFVAMALDRAGFEFVYGTTSPPRHPDFEIDWRNDLASARHGRNLRCVFVASRKRLACAHLVELVTR
jgi:SAM-dependent methyltransferase